MITVSENLGFGDMDMGDLAGRRKAIRGLRPSGKSFSKGSRYLVTESEARRRGIDLQPGQVIPPGRAHIPEVAPAEVPSGGSYLVRSDDDSVTVPDQMVRVVGYNTIAPSMRNFQPVKGKVVEIGFKPVPVGPGVEIYPEQQDFVATTDEVDIPGLPSEPIQYQQFPKRQYPPQMTKVLDEEMEVESEAGVEGTGTLRVPDNTGFDDLGQWAEIISAAAKVGTDAYAAKQAKKAEKKAARAEARASAAPPVWAAPQAPVTTGMDTTTMLLIAGGGLALVGVTVFLLRK